MIGIKRMFPGGNTSEGFFSYHKYITNNIHKKKFILKGGPGSGKSTIMTEIGDEMLEKGYSIEYHHCPSDRYSVDGIVVQELGIAILDGTAPHIIDPELPGIMDEIIDLGRYIDSEKLMENKDIIINAKSGNKNCYRRTYSYFRAARQILNQIIEENSECVDFKSRNRMILDLIAEIYSTEGDKNLLGGERHLFGSAFTPSGFVDYTDALLEGLERVYFVTGDYGTGKSTLLGKVYENGKIRGYYIEVYHDPFIPQKINTVLIPELNIGFTTSTMIGDNYFKKINLDEYFNISRKNENDYKAYKELIDLGISNLSNAKANHDILEKYYHLAIDFDGVNKEKEYIINEIENL